MDVVIIGTGNVAVAIGKKIRKTEHNLLQIAGRNSLHAARAGKELGVGFVAEFSLINHNADFYIAAIADDALPGLGKWLQLDKKIVVHTAGSVSKDVLKPVSRNYGVLYPLQSLTRSSTHEPDIPFLVDGNTPDDLTLIKDFALSLSDKVEVAGDEERLKIHLAAVVVNNFTNHLYAMAEKFCEEEKIDFTLFRPLIMETASRLNAVDAAKAQTGPAIRADHSTIARHLSLLARHPRLKKMYEVMTAAIQEFYQTRREQ